MKSPLTVRVLWLWLLASAAAGAHEEGISVNGFSSGLIHPVTGLDHLIAMVAVGLWGAQLGGRLMWLLPVLFPVVMAFGGALGIRGVPLPGGEMAIALSGVLLGLAILCRWRPPEWVALLLTGMFAIFHGHAHGMELPRAAGPIAYGIGFVLATGFLHLGGILLGCLDAWKPIGPKGVRGVGALIAGAGGWFLYQSIAG